MERLIEWEPVAAGIENVFKDHRLFDMKGEIKACCKLASVPLTHIAVVTWKTKVLGQNTSDKKRSIACCQRLYPNADLLRATPMGKKMNVNGDRAEAVLIAHHIRTTLTSMP